MHANQQFSKRIREVERGKVILIARRGCPIAKLASHNADEADDPSWAAACRRLMSALDECADLGGLKVDRDELWER